MTQSSPNGNVQLRSTAKPESHFNWRDALVRPVWATLHFPLRYQDISAVHMKIALSVIIACLAALPARSAPQGGGATKLADWADGMSQPLAAYSFEESNGSYWARSSTHGPFPTIIVNRTAYETKFTKKLAASGGICSAYAKGLVTKTLIHENYHVCAQINSCGSWANPPMSDICEEFMADASTASAICDSILALECEKHEPGADPDALEEEQDGLRDAHEEMQNKWAESGPKGDSAKDCSAMHGGTTCPECSIRGSTLSMPTHAATCQSMNDFGSGIPDCPPLPTGAELEEACEELDDGGNGGE